MSARTAARLLVAACTLLGGCGACEPDRAAPQDASPASSALPSVGFRAPLPRPPARPACRVIAVNGDARLELGADASTPVSVQDRVLGSNWITLAPAAHLVVREPRTARETSVQGPGRARMCADSQQNTGEEAWLAAGDFESSPGSGEYPGAEQWVVTAQGVVRYAAARVSVRVRPEVATVAVSEGTAFLWPANDTDFVATPPATESEGWQRISTGGRAKVTSKAHGKAENAPPRDAEAVTRSAATCSLLATRARRLAAALLSPAPPAPERDSSADAAAEAPAAEQVRVRRLARAACAVAHVRAEKDASEGTRDDISRTLREADSAWRGLPGEAAEGDSRSE